MSLRLHPALVTPVIKATCAGLGTAVGGPAGGVVAGFIGGAIFSPAIIHLLEKLPEQVGSKVFEKFFESTADPILDAIKKEDPRTLGQAYRDSLRLALASMSPPDKLGYEIWFAHWNACLGREADLTLPGLQRAAITPDSLDTFLADSLVLLDAEQVAFETASTSLNLTPFSRGPLPPPLFAALQTKLPALLTDTFDQIVVQKAYQPAFNTTLLNLLRGLIDSSEIIQTALNEIKQSQHELSLQLGAVGTDVLDLKDELRQYTRARAEGTVPAFAPSELYAELARIQKLNEELTQRLAAEAVLPIEQEIARLREAGKDDEAFHLQQNYVAKLDLITTRRPQALYNLGLMYEGRYDWPNAYASFRKAWELEENPDFGIKCALFATRQRDFPTAIKTCEKLLSQVLEAEDRATLLNNLGILYRHSQRIPEAETVYDHALIIRRALAEENSQAYLPDVAKTLNNLGILYRASQRLEDAEAAHDEALSIRRMLAKTNVHAYAPTVGTTLNSLGNLYTADERMAEAEAAYDEALGIYRKLAKDDPHAYLSGLGGTLNNIGILYSKGQRMQEAKTAYEEALAIRRSLAKDNAQAYFPDVATTLNNLATNQRFQGSLPEAENSAREAESILTPFWRNNDAAHAELLSGIRYNSALIARESANPTEACRRARAALEVAVNPSMKATLETLIAEVCPDSPTGP